MSIRIKSGETELQVDSQGMPFTDTIRKLCAFVVWMGFRRVKPKRRARR